ncbi:hypothetical protein EYF80_005683 [Liparis tanakae]|uniref:Uncharacterized protein n=1 Tax=Liparis tanakae TaxID=230148 RepID=A0A4Z2J229_9TELE|nr:hypothetical protein EYF80_005683 [Liparis tanakae]
MGDDSEAKRMKHTLTQNHLDTLKITSESWLNSDIHGGMQQQSPPAKERPDCWEVSRPGFQKASCNYHQYTH